MVTPLRKATSYEPRIVILVIWGDTWLTRGIYGIYVAVRGIVAEWNASGENRGETLIEDCLLKQIIMFVMLSSLLRKTILKKS